MVGLKGQVWKFKVGWQGEGREIGWAKGISPELGIYYAGETGFSDARRNLV